MYYCNYKWFVAQIYHLLHFVIPLVTYRLMNRKSRPFTDTRPSSTLQRWIRERADRDDPIRFNESDFLRYIWQGWLFTWTRLIITWVQALKQLKLKKQHCFENICSAWNYSCVYKVVEFSELLPNTALVGRFFGHLYLTMTLAVLICISDSMFSWVIKVVPQPPASPGKLAEEDQNASTAASATVSLWTCTLIHLSLFKHVFTVSALFFRMGRKKRK